MSRFPATSSSFVSTAVSEKVAHGKFYINGTKMAIPITEMGLSRLTNPADSGKNIFILKLTMYSDLDVFVHYHMNMSAALTNPVTPTAYLNANFGYQAVAPLGFLESSIQATHPVGWEGTRLSSESRLEGGALTLDLPPFIMPPNNSFTVALDNEGGSTINFRCNVYWVEEKVTA